MERQQDAEFAQCFNLMICKESMHLRVDLGKESDRRRRGWEHDWANVREDREWSRYDEKWIRRMNNEFRTCWTRRVRDEEEEGTSVSERPKAFSLWPPPLCLRSKKWLDKPTHARYFGQTSFVWPKMCDCSRLVFWNNVFKDHLTAKELTIGEQ